MVLLKTPTVSAEFVNLHANNVVYDATVMCQGLKTGMYYLRTRAAADAIKFTVDTSLLKVNTSPNCRSIFFF